MKRIKFTGWKKGMNKIEFIQLLRSHTELSLEEAKNIKDRIVDGEIIEIVVKPAIAQYLVDESRKYGVFAEIIE
jgi:ribosomal protein L7/L12